MIMSVHKYFDGSGNGYIIEKAESITIEYNPIKPEFSSSGIYDGGEYVKKKITTSQYENILSLLNSATLKTEEHVKERMKGTGLIVIDGENKYILSVSSKIKDKIEENLKVLL